MGGGYQMQKSLSEASGGKTLPAALLASARAVGEGRTQAERSRSPRTAGVVRVASLIRIAIILLLACQAMAQGPVPLFDGISLAGWKTQGQGKWEVRDGAIHGSAEASNPRNAWLISGKTYRDFDFRFRFRGVIGNSGLQFRSLQGTEDVTGVQVDLDAGRTTGGLYELIVRNGQYAGQFLAQPAESQVRSLYRADDWNLVELKVRGKHVEVALNGTRVVNHDLARVEAEGFFAFQLHDKLATRISLKDIDIVEANPTAIPAPRSRNGREEPGPPCILGLSPWNIVGRTLTGRLAKP